MRRLLLALLAVALAGCATPRTQTVPWSGPTYTRAAVERLPTAELAAALLSPERAAEVERHSVRNSVYHQGRDLQAVDFYQRPYPLAEDVCLRQVITVSFTDPVRYPRARLTQDLPKRVESVRAVPEIALLRYCAARPGRRFARLAGELSLGEGVQILRSLAAVRALAEGDRPLPFRLRCIRLRGEEADCTAADRATLAALPLHAAYEVQRRPGPGSCQPDDQLGGDLVLLDLERPGYWQVRMMRMGTPDATVLISADGRRVACL